MKTRFFTRITDVTTEGGDEPPIRKVEVSKRPFIFDDNDLSVQDGFTYQPFSEEDKIEKEIPISITNDISR